MAKKMIFDNERYLKEQAAEIRKRIKESGNKLYLEFGGKLLLDYHAARVLPGYDPNIKIRLSDISGNIIAERIFNAKTYLKKMSNPFLLMKPKIPVHINFEVVDPGKDAVNFEFNFL